MEPVVVVLLTVIIGCSILLFLLSSSNKKLPPANKKPSLELNWIIATDDQLYRPDSDALIKDRSFVERVAHRIEQGTGCQTAPGGDLIRVYKRNRLIGVVKCCEIGRNVSPATVRALVELAQHLRVKTMYLATMGPVPKDTEQFALLQKVRLVSF